MATIGRKEELALLEAFTHSNKPEFLAVYGRRRVGKTYLIRQFFQGKDVVFFNVTGIKNGSMKEQITHFTQRISEVFYDGIKLQAGKNWSEAFEMLNKALAQVAKRKQIVLFFDELPWMVTPKSKLLQLLDYYWNQYWSDDKRIKLIVCGSSASWIINKIIKNKGGLHNRVTKKIHLMPFNLAETKQFLHHQGVKLNHQQIVLLYMAMGGIPFYLAQIEKGFSAAQIIEKLAFSRSGFLLEEFDNLFASLFEDPSPYVEMIRLLAQHQNGLGQSQLLSLIDKRFKGGGGLKKINDLEMAGFITRFHPLYHKRQGVYYRLTDEYIIFYLKWIEPMRNTLQGASLEKGNWQALQTTPAWYGWLGYAFESVCYKHIYAIKKALGVGPNAKACAWRYAPKKNTETDGAQIDLLFDRTDGSVTICEIKYTDKPFVVDKAYAKVLMSKIEIYKKITRTQKQIFIAFISANGIKETLYSEELVASHMALDALFED